MSRQRAIASRSIGKALRPIGGSWRTKVRRAFEALANGQSWRWDDAARRRLCRAIFEVENELEHRSPKHPQVVAMRATRNVLLDDLGENEQHPHGCRYPSVEAAERVIRRRRKTSEAQRAQARTNALAFKRPSCAVRP